MREQNTRFLCNTSPSNISRGCMCFSFSNVCLLTLNTHPHIQFASEYFNLIFTHNHEELCHILHVCLWPVHSVIATINFQSTAIDASPAVKQQILVTKHPCGIISRSLNLQWLNLFCPCLTRVSSLVESDGQFIFLGKLAYIAVPPMLCLRQFKVKKNLVRGLGPVR